MRTVSKKSLAPLAFALGASVAATSPAGAVAVTDATIETFLGLGAGALDGLIGDNATDGSAVKTTIVVGAPGTSLAFDWVFDSFDGGSATYADFAFVSLVGSGGATAVLDLLASNPSGPYSVATSSALTIAVADTYTLGFGVLDEDDAIFSAAFLLDNITLAGTAIADGSFENGFGSWSTIGDTAIVGSFGGGFDPFAASFSPTAGQAQALLDFGDTEFVDFDINPLSSIPEPGTIALYGLGLLGLGLALRGKRRAKGSRPPA